MELNVPKESFWEFLFKSIEEKRKANEVLNKSPFSCKIKNEFVIEYDNNESRLIIVYKIPKATDIPDIIEYKYVKTKNEVTTKCHVKML